jgi:hypothetical protein
MRGITRTNSDQELQNPLLEPQEKVLESPAASAASKTKSALIKRIDAYLARTLVPDPAFTFSMENNTIEIKPEKRQILNDLRELLAPAEGAFAYQNLDDGLDSVNNRLSNLSIENLDDQYKALYQRALDLEPQLVTPKDGPAYMVPHPKSQVSRMVVAACKEFDPKFSQYEKKCSPTDTTLLNTYREKYLRTLYVDADHYLQKTANTITQPVGMDGKVYIQVTYTPHFLPKVELVESLQATIEKLQYKKRLEPDELKDLYQRALDQAPVTRKDGCFGLFGRNSYIVPDPRSRVSRMIVRLCKEFDPTFQDYEKTCKPDPQVRAAASAPAPRPGA